MLDNHPPEGAILRSQAAWIPPLDLSSSRSRGMPPQAFGTTASLRSVCPGSAYSLVLVLARLRSEIRTLPSFSPVVEARRASNSALDRGVAWGEDVGNAALAVCRGSFRRKMDDYHRGRFHGGELPTHTHTHTQQNVARIAHPPSPPYWCWVKQSSFTQSFRLLQALDPYGDQN